MNKKIIFGIIVFLVFLSFFFPYSKLEESRIISEIDKANYCMEASDCVNVQSKCPFGCWIYVNKLESDKIMELINSYDSKCVYDCLYCPNVTCENNKCKEVCD